MIFPVQLLIYCNDNNIFGGETGHFGGKLLKYPSLNNNIREGPAERFVS